MESIGLSKTVGKPMWVVSLPLVFVLIAILFIVISSLKFKVHGKQEFETTFPVEDLDLSKTLEDGRGLGGSATPLESEITVSKEGSFLRAPSPLSPSEVFELEKRAIFSKVWLCVSHCGRFSKPGDYHSVDVAGLSFFIILGKDYVLRSFHNVCRHRAYNILRKSQGSSLVLGCKYHGWSYSSKGELVKAPQFENVEGFDKSQNGLFEIHTKVSDHGFIFVNLEGGRQVLAPDFRDIDTFSTQFGLSKGSRWVAGWKEELRIDWKALLGSDFSDGSGLLGKLLTPSSSSAPMLHLFPGTILKKINSRTWASVSFFPAAAGLLVVRCDIYDTNVRAKGMPEKDKAIAKANVRALISNIKATSDGGLSPTREKETDPDVKYRLRPLLDLHLALETERGHKIDPTTRHEGRLNEDAEAAMSKYTPYSHLLVILCLKIPPRLTHSI
jgi:nitrite reductase/ring-hydroxylating ferredoxin subunit